MHNLDDTAALTRSELFGQVPPAETMLVVKASSHLRFAIVPPTMLRGAAAVPIDGMGRGLVAKTKSYCFGSREDHAEG